MVFVLTSYSIKDTIQTTGEDEFQEIGPTGHTTSYLELLKQQDDFINMTEQQQQIYIQKVIEFLDSNDPYEQERNRLLEQFSELTLEIQTTNDEDKLEDLQDQYDSILAQLEELGVATTNKLEGNEQYYVDKYERAKEIFNDSNDNPSLTIDVDYVHTDDVSKDTVLFPYTPFPFGTVSCPTGSSNYCSGMVNAYLAYSN